MRLDRLIEADLADASAHQDAQMGPDCVMYLAAHAYVGESDGNPLQYFGDNIVNTLNLLDAWTKRCCN